MRYGSNVLKSYGAALGDCLAERYLYPACAVCRHHRYLVFCIRHGTDGGAVTAKTLHLRHYDKNISTLIVRRLFVTM